MSHVADDRPTYLVQMELIEDAVGLQCPRCFEIDHFEASVVARISGHHRACSYCGHVARIPNREILTT